MPRRDVGSTARGYRKHPGMIAWLFHRITGIILVLYFMVHMLGSSASIDFFSNIARNIYVESFIVVMFAWHAANGLRIIFMEFFRAAERSCFKKSLAIFSLLALLIAFVGLYYAKVHIDKEAAKAKAAEAEKSAAIESVITHKDLMAYNTAVTPFVVETAKGE